MTPPLLKTRSTAELAAGTLSHELPDKPVCLDSLGYGARMPHSHHRHRPSPDICSSAAMRRSLSLTGMMAVVPCNWPEALISSWEVMAISQQEKKCFLGNKYFITSTSMSTSTEGSSTSTSTNTLYASTSTITRKKYLSTAQVPVPVPSTTSPVKGINTRHYDENTLTSLQQLPYSFPVKIIAHENTSHRYEKVHIYATAMCILCMSTFKNMVGFLLLFSAVNYSCSHYTVTVDGLSGRS